MENDFDDEEEGPYEEVVIDKSLYRVKGNGTLRIWSIFLESAKDKEFSVFWKGPDHKEYEGRTIYSFRKLFMEVGDVTGVLFAQQYLDGIYHWDRLCNAGEPRLTPFIAQCVEDLKRVVAASAIQDTILASEGGNQSAAKLLIGREYEVLIRGKGKVGRPAKEAKEEHIDKAFGDYNDLVDILNQQEGETAQ